MSMIPMFKYCARCGCPAPVDPDVGQMGLFCPQCKKFLVPFPFPIPRKKAYCGWKIRRICDKMTKSKEGPP